MRQNEKKTMRHIALAYQFYRNWLQCKKDRVLHWLQKKKTTVLFLSVVTCYSSLSSLKHILRRILVFSLPRHVYYTNCVLIWQEPRLFTQTAAFNVRSPAKSLFSPPITKGRILWLQVNLYVYYSRKVRPGKKRSKLERDSCNRVDYALKTHLNCALV